MQNIIISGGSSGIGRATAELLAQKGNHVVVLSRTPYRNDYLKNITPIPCDITSEESVHTAFKLIMKKCTTIDVLINSAGTGVVGPIEEIPQETIEKVFDINVMGSIRLIKKTAPVMREQGRGKIINIGSIGGRVGLPFQGIYSASKFAVTGITEALAIELKPFGIQVHLVEPGDFNTNINNNRFNCTQNTKHYSEKLDGFYDRICNNVVKGSDPKEAAKKIASLIKRKNGRFKIRPAKFHEKITPITHDILPDKLFQNILKSFYKL